MDKALHEALKQIFKRIEDLCIGTKDYADDILAALYSLEDFYDLLDKEDEDE